MVQHWLQTRTAVRLAPPYYGLATLFVAVTILATVLSAAAEGQAGLAVASALFVMSNVVPALILLPVQRAINLSLGDPEGARNRSLSGTNWAWIAFGAIIWLLWIAGTSFELMGFLPDVD